MNPICIHCNLPTEKIEIYAGSEIYKDSEAAPFVPSGTEVVEYEYICSNFSNTKDYPQCSKASKGGASNFLLTYDLSGNLIHYSICLGEYGIFSARRYNHCTGIHRYWYHEDVRGFDFTCIFQINEFTMLNPSSYEAVANCIKMLLLFK